MEWWVLYIIIGVVVAIIGGGIFFLRKKFKKKQDDQQGLLNQHKQTVSILVLEKKSIGSVAQKADGGSLQLRCH